MCSIEGCDGDVFSRGLCPRHWGRWQRYGDPTAGGPDRAARNALRRFVEDALGSDTDECILWPFPSKVGNGYGHLRWNGRMRRANRVVCEEAHGPCPPGMQAAHSCGQPGCVNPRHLRWATPAENKADELTDGTRRRGSRWAHAKLTEDDVRAIRTAVSEGKTQRELSGQYGVSMATIGHIATGRNWKWLI